MKTASPHTDRDSLLMDWHAEIPGELPAVEQWPASEFAVPEQETQLRQAEWLQVEGQAEAECLTWFELVRVFLWVLALFALTTVLSGLAGYLSETLAAFPISMLYLLRAPPQKDLDLKLLVSSGALEVPEPGLLGRLIKWVRS